MSGWVHHFFDLGDLELWLLLGVVLLGLVVVTVAGLIKRRRSR